MFENNIKSQPFPQSTSTKKDDIIHEEEMGKSQCQGYFYTSDMTIPPSIIDQKTEPFNHQNE